MTQREQTLHCNALLFDLDGVLVDSASCIERLLREWAVSHDLVPEEVIKAAHGRRTIETVRVVAPHLDAAAEAEALTTREATTTEGIAEVPGAHALVSALSPSRWAIVTSGARPVATLRLRTTGLPEPRILICAEDVSRGKPDPEGYLAAASALHVAPEECIVVEDAPAGLAAASAAGMRSIGVVGTHRAIELAQATAIVANLASLRVVDTGPSGHLVIYPTIARW